VFCARFPRAAAAHAKIFGAPPPAGTAWQKARKHDGGLDHISFIAAIISLLASDDKDI